MDESRRDVEPEPEDEEETPLAPRRTRPRRGGTPPQPVERAVTEAPERR